ncbi:hypothetical protein C8R45DRAFT_1112251 [Mycena sanguinolenta]|nr:hypothetical protein C8R45DRAFT_1112251 [Mycena sanguinolenta]
MRTRIARRQTHRSSRVVSSARLERHPSNSVQRTLLLLLLLLLLASLKAPLIPCSCYLRTSKCFVSPCAMSVLASSSRVIAPRHHSIPAIASRASPVVIAYHRHRASTAALKTRPAPQTAHPNTTHTTPSPRYLGT